MVSCRRMFFGLCIRPRHISSKLLVYTTIIIFVFTLYVVNENNHIKSNSVSLKKGILSGYTGDEEIDAKSPETEDEKHQKRILNYYDDNVYQQQQGQLNYNKDVYNDAKLYKNVAGNQFNDNDKAFDSVQNSGNYKRKYTYKRRNVPSVDGNLHLLGKRWYSNVDTNSYDTDPKPLAKRKSYPSFPDNNNNNYNDINNNNVNNNNILKRSESSNFKPPMINYQNYVLENHLPQKKEAVDDDELRNVYIVKKSSQKTTTKSPSTTTPKWNTVAVTPGINQFKKRLSAKDKRKDIRKCNKVRMQRLRNRCRDIVTLPLEKRNETEIINLAKMIITDDKHRVLINALPKTGCSSWKMVMLNNSGMNIEKPGQRPTGGINNWKLLNQYGLKDLSEFTVDHIVYRMKYFYSILTVRHPFERLESAFRDKFGRTNKYYNGKVGTKIKEKFRVNNNNREAGDVMSANVTFEEFVRFSLEPENKDRHWMPIWDLANPCVLPYQYIAKTETASRDMDYIAATKLSYGVSGGGYQYNPTQKEEQVQIKSAKILPLFSQLSPSVQEELLLRVLEKYMDDMELFGYRIRREGGSVIADCEMYSPEGMCC